MKTELRDKWVAALRSGKYKQTKEKLRSRNGSYCCLGVLCEVVGVERTYDSTLGGYQYDGDSSDLSDSVLKKVGLTGGTTHRLMDMNDDQGKSFKEIADWIEKNVRPHRKAKG